MKTLSPKQKAKSLGLSCCRYTLGNKWDGTYRIAYAVYGPDHPRGTPGGVANQLLANVSLSEVHAWLDAQATQIK